MKKLSKPQLILKSKKAVPIDTNEYIELNVGEKGLSAHIKTDYNLTEMSIKFVAEGFDRNIINGGTVVNREDTLGEFDFIWPEALTNMSSGFGQPFKGQFTLTSSDGNLVDVLSPFLIIVKPTIGIQESYKGTIDTVDGMIKQTLADLKALQEIVQQGKDASDSELSSLKDYFDHQAQSLIDTVNARIASTQNAIDGLQTQITSEIQNAQLSTDQAVAKIKADAGTTLEELKTKSNAAISGIQSDGKNAIKKVSDDGTATITQINNDFTTLVQTFTQQINKFILTNQNTINLKLDGWQIQIDTIKQTVKDAKDKADALKSQVDTIQQTDVKNLTDKLNDIKAKIDNLQNDQNLLNLQEQIDKKADKTELSDYAKTSDLASKADKSYVDDQIDTRSSKKKAYLKVVPKSKHDSITSIKVAGYATYDDTDFDGDFTVTFSFRNSVDSKDAICSFFIVDEKGEKISDLDFSKFAQIERIQVTSVGGKSDTGLYKLVWDKVKQTIEISSVFYDPSTTVWASIPIKTSTGTF